VVFSIWDRLHGTFVEREPDAITTGAPDDPDPPPRGFFALLALPFRPRGAS
jgi:sterol desaturase/sphingolipid hydroxylase (fatty acid hydroxylase superfamily)